MEESKVTTRWILDKFITSEHFKNTIALMVSGVYCYLICTNSNINSEFHLLAGIVLGSYFKKD